MLRNRNRTIRKMGVVHVRTDLEYPVLPVSAGGLTDRLRPATMPFASKHQGRAVIESLVASLRDAWASPLERTIVGKKA